MKKLLSLLLTLTACLFLGVACKDDSTDETQTQIYTVKFVQEGQEDVIVEVNEGETVEDSLVPEIVDVAGYDIAWDKDFSIVNQDLVITAVKTPKTYTITYTYDTRLTESDYVVVLTQTTQSVQYNAPYTLATASITGGERILDFVGWKNVATSDIFTNGNYTLTENIILIAVFEPQEQEWS